MLGNSGQYHVDETRRTLGGETSANRTDRECLGSDNFLFWPRPGCDNLELSFGKRQSGGSVAEIAAGEGSVRLDPDDAIR